MIFDSKGDKIEALKLAMVMDFGNFYLKDKIKKSNGEFERKPQDSWREHFRFTGKIEEN